jgi:hypothetical protein
MTSGTTRATGDRETGNGFFKIGGAGGATERGAAFIDRRFLRSRLDHFFAQK